MTMTPEEIHEGTRMLGVLDQQIALLEQRHARQFARFFERPSRDQFFMLASDAEGVARMGTDATFVAERVFFDGRVVFQGDAGDNNYYPALPDIQLRDQSSGRVLTEAQQVSFPAVRDLQAGVPPGASVYVQTEFGSPLVALPLYGGGGRYSGPIGTGGNGGFGRALNTDYMRKLPVELEVPRGGVVSVRYRNQYGQYLAYPFVLVGYKVF